MIIFQHVFVLLPLSAPSSLLTDSGLHFHHMEIIKRSSKYPSLWVLMVGIKEDGCPWCQHCRCLLLWPSIVCKQFLITIWRAGQPSRLLHSYSVPWTV